MQDQFKDGPQIVPFVQRGDPDEVWDRPLPGAGPGPYMMAARQSATPTPATSNPPPRATAPQSRRISASRFGFWYLGRFMVVADT